MQSPSSDDCQTRKQTRCWHYKSLNFVLLSGHNRSGACVAHQNLSPCSYALPPGRNIAPIQASRSIGRPKTSKAPTIVSWISKSEDFTVLCLNREKLGSYSQEKRDIGQAEIISSCQSRAQRANPFCVNPVKWSGRYSEPLRVNLRFKIDLS